MTDTTIPGIRDEYLMFDPYISNSFNYIIAAYNNKFEYVKNSRIYFNSKATPFRFLDIIFHKRRKQLEYYISGWRGTLENFPDFVNIGDKDVEFIKNSYISFIKEMFIVVNHPYIKYKALVEKHVDFRAFFLFVSRSSYNTELNKIRSIYV